tara:strand:+ start:6127 stop:10917 length:4791 start_codon:yes stop_codon:yes gene_type:complete
MANEVRSVTLPNGHTYTSVPDSVSDAEAWDIWQSENNENEEPSYQSGSAPVITSTTEEIDEVPRSLTGPTYEKDPDYLKNVKIDFGRIFADTKADLTRLGLYGATRLGKAAGMIDDETEKVLESPELAAAITERAAEPIARVINEDVRTLYDSETGRIFPMDTAPGTVAEIGTYMYGGVKIFKNLPDLLSKSKVWRNNFFKSTASGIGIDQLLTNPDYNVSNAVEEALGEEASREWNNYLFLAADKDDSESVKRLKLIGEGALVGALIDVIGGANTFRRYIRNKFNKTPQELTKEDKGTLLVEYLEEQKNVIKSSDDWRGDYLPSAQTSRDDILEDAAAIRNLQEDPELRFGETPQGEAQIKMQQSSGLNRLFRTVFTSRGFWTPRVFDAFNDSKYAQRATVNEAEVISRNLNNLLKNFNDQDPDVLSRVNRAFNEKLDNPSSPFLNQIENIAKNYDLPDELAAQVLEGRKFIDQLSDRLTSSSMVDEDLKRIIEENMGSYLRRSFRLFEDPNYRPSDEIKNDAINFISQRYMNEGRQADIARQAAELDVNSILDKGDTVGLDYISNVQKLNNNIFKGKEDVPLAIRKLMGEIENVDESFLITAQKMTKFYEDSRFYDNLLRLGEGKYIFKVARTPQSDALPGTEAVPSTEPRFTVTEDGDEIVFDTDIYNTRIAGTGSQLDFAKNGQYEYYTTPEIAGALKQEQGTLSFNIKGSMLGNFIDGTARNFLSLKGFSQKNKTVYSITTQSRNVLGGFQFGPANGINPFGQEAVQTFKTLTNQSSQSNEALNELYQKYQRLGIINTNATINEFRALLNSGMDADQNILVSLTNKLKGYGFLKRKTKAITDVSDKWVFNPAESAYLGVDDFFKVINYNSELATLKRAHPTTDIKILEAEASRKIRATIPNYDFVPPGIKVLRYMPFGSFVSFPAEIVRTSANIYREAFKEMASGNAELQIRGAQRFAGRTATAGAWYGLQQGLSAAYGFTNEQLEAIQTADEKPWSTVSPRLPLMMDDKIYTIDTQFLNAYETTNAPFELLYEEVKNGSLKGDSLDKAIVDAGFKALGDIMSPYVDQPIFTQAITDVAYALYSDDGRTPSGKELFNPATPTMDKFQNGTYHILESFVPTAAFSMADILNSDAMLEKPNASTGKVRPTNLELAATFLGIRVTELDPEISFGYRVSEFNGKNNALTRPQINYENSPEEIVEQYINTEKQRYRNTQEFYRQFLATRELIGLPKTVQVLFDRGVTQDEISSLISGKYFNPRQPLTDANLVNVFEKTPFDKDSELNSVGKLSTALINEYTKMLNTNLYFDTEEEIGDPKPKEDEFMQFNLAKGGEVYNVPQAPVEPDERIDKMTGLPYNEQAGEAFIDQEERGIKIDFNKGGKVLRSLQRTRKAEGGGFFGMLDKAVKKGAKILGFDDDRQIQISADATDLTKQIAPDKEVTWTHQGKPITTDELRNLKTNRDKISLSGDEETFDAVNHALFGYESAESPVAAFAGQAKEVYQGAKQVVKGQEWRTELKDMWNNSWGIKQREQGLSRPEFDMALAQAIMNTNNKLKRGETLRMGEDVVLNALDLAQREQRNTGGKVLNSLHKNCK